MAKQQIGSVDDICADCGTNDPNWVSLNRGVLICNDCCLIHRSLGRHISDVKSIKSSVWRTTRIQMINELVRSGSNSIWEHTLLDPLTGKTGLRRKPSPKDPLHPNKSEFIRTKYQNLSFINRSTTESETDISEQLHSSVRTPNLKTSLRLLASGADLNYIHNEKYNCPLHMAAKAGQMSQIELLLVYGANPCVVDVRGKTPIDYAKEANFNDIVDRLVESQYELSDRLTYFVCGRLPDHKSGQHFLIPELIDSKDRTQDSKLKLQSLSNKIFEELTRDVFDEVDRREVDAIFNASQNSSQEIPFLPVNTHFSSTRNQGRQKLARLNGKEFVQLIIDVLYEIRRRLHGVNDITLTKKNIKTNSMSNSSEKNVKNNLDFSDESSDSEPLYDSVASEDEDIVLKVLESNSSLSNRYLKSKTTKGGPKSSVALDEYQSLKDRLCRSDSLIEELVLGNQEMKFEITRLQVMVQKLIDENAQLRAVVVPKCQTQGVLLNNSEQEVTPPEVLPRNAIKSPTRPQSMFNERPPVPTPTSPTKYSSSLNNLQQNASQSQSSSLMSSPSNEKFNSNQRDSQFGNTSHILNETTVPSKLMTTFSFKEEVLRKTEQITRRIQELLTTAKDGKHEEFDSCSERISSAVADMITIFPENFVSMTNGGNGQQMAIYSALTQLHSSALKLRVECRPALNACANVLHSQQDFRQIYEKVIESAFDIAKAAKTLVTICQ